MKHVSFPASYDAQNLGFTVTNHAKAIKELQEIVEKQRAAILDLLRVVNVDAEESDTFAGGSSVVD